MRKITYIVDGLFETASYQEAKTWCDKEHGYMRAVLTSVYPDQVPATPIRKAMLEQFGMVAPKYRDKVVLA